jgi:hypothetical protein
MTTPEKLGPYWVKKLTGDIPPIPYRLLIFNDVGQVNAERPVAGTSSDATGNLNQIQEFYNGGTEIGGVFGPSWGISFPYGWYKCVSTSCSISTVGPAALLYDQFNSVDGTDPTTSTLTTFPVVTGLSQWVTTTGDAKNAGKVMYKALFGPATIDNLPVLLECHATPSRTPFVTSFPYFVTMTATNSETAGNPATSYVRFGLYGSSLSETKLTVASDGLVEIKQVGETGNNNLPRFPLTPGTNKIGIYVTASTTISMANGAQVGQSANIGSSANMHTAYVEILNPNDAKCIDSIGVYSGVTIQQALMLTL